jgi:hypothetical protein
MTTVKKKREFAKSDVVIAARAILDVPKGTVGNIVRVIDPNRPQARCAAYWVRFDGYSLIGCQPDDLHRPTLRL